MSTEFALGQKEKKAVVNGLEVLKVGGDYSYLRSALSDHYFRAWSDQGLCVSPNEAKGRLDRYYESGVFESSFIVARPEREKIYSLLLTVNIRADSTFDLLQKIPRYRSFESRVIGSDRGREGFSVCFSITSDSRFRAKKDSATISLSRLNLFEYETPPGYFKAAYSRLAGVGRSNPYRFYVRNLTKPQILGPTGMHEWAYGGVTLAIIKGSRPEDASGGGVNTFILLPRDGTQKEINAQILEGRKRGCVPYEKIGSFLLFSDTWPYLSLAR